MSEIKIALIDMGGTGIQKSEPPLVALALQQQLQSVPRLEDGGYDLPEGGRVRACKPYELQRDEWPILLLRHPDQAGALGDHDFLRGVPFGRVFPLLDAQDGQPWSSTASHEMMEFLVDPDCQRTRQAFDGCTFADECADPVEQLLYSVDVPGGRILLSDYVLPGWYTGRGRLDYLGKLSSPLEVAAGGYAQWFDPSTGQWNQVTNFERSELRHYREEHSFRGDKRRRHGAPDSRFMISMGLTGPTGSVGNPETYVAGPVVSSGVPSSAPSIDPDEEVLVVDEDDDSVLEAQLDEVFEEAGQPRRVV